MSLEPGSVVMGRYRITRRLAAGGMGVVYLARIEGAEGFTRPVVIKRMLPLLSRDDELVRMFAREARVLASLHHPNIVSVLDFASEEDAHLMALEHVHGYSLAHWAKYLRLRETPFPVGFAVWIVAQVLDALHYAHTRADGSGRSLGIVHRDVSPSNVLLDVEGHVKLVDFGVARPISEHTAPKDGEVSVRGKFPYMAPELLGGGEPGPRTDLYACGVLLHELLRGQNELRDRDPERTIGRVLMHRLSSLAPLRDDVSEALDRAIQQATAKDPTERFSDAAQMADALRAVLPEREDRLRTEMRARVRADFLGDLPELLDVDPLEELEDAWKAPSTEAAPAEPARPNEPERPRGSDAPTRVAVVLPAPAPRTGRWVMAGTLIVALAVLAGAGVLAYGGRGRGPERVLVVERRVDDAIEPAGDPLAPASNAPDDPPTTPEDPPSPSGESPLEPATKRGRAARGGDRAAALTRTFDARQARLRRCFESHALELEGSPQVAIRFQIDESGAVSEADLIPSELAPTALGRCLLAVARETSFGPQPGPLAFRIPIQVRSR